MKDLNQPAAQITLRSSFSSAHLYHQPLWDEAKNREVFGRCFTTHGHGHNYTLEVSFAAQESSLATQAQKLQAELDALTQVLDHEHLNFVIAEFQKQIPTTENIALYFLEKLKTRQLAVLRLRVYEMPNLWSEVIP